MKLWSAVIRYVVSLLVLLTPLSIQAADAAAEQQAKTQFLQQVLGSTAPVAPKRLWLTPAMQQAFTQLIGEAYPSAMLRYWPDPKQSGRYIFLLEAIGKEDWITAGFVVQSLPAAQAGSSASAPIKQVAQIEQAQVVIYREIRGGEIQSLGFLQQFRQLRSVNTEGKQTLSRSIDGITGATLSVHAMTKMAKMALFFAEQIDSIKPAVENHQQPVEPLHAH